MLSEQRACKEADHEVPLSDVAGAYVVSDVRRFTADGVILLKRMLCHGAVKEPDGKKWGVYAVTML